MFNSYKITNDQKYIKTSIIILICLLNFILSACSCYLCNSELTIRNELLRNTPIGTDMEKIKAYLLDQGCYDKYYVEDRGFLKQEAGMSASVVGDKSIRAHLGEYRDGEYIFL